MCNFAKMKPLTCVTMCTVIMRGTNKCKETRHCEKMSTGKHLNACSHGDLSFERLYLLLAAISFSGHRADLFGWSLPEGRGSHGDDMSYFDFPQKLALLWLCILVGFQEPVKCLNCGIRS